MGRRSEVPSTPDDPHSRREGQPSRAPKEGNAIREDPAIYLPLVLMKTIEQLWHDICQERRQEADKFWQAITTNAKESTAGPLTEKDLRETFELFKRSPVHYPLKPLPRGMWDFIMNSGDADLISLTKVCFFPVEYIRGSDEE